MIIKPTPSSINGCIYQLDGKSPCQRMLQDANEKSKQSMVGHFTPSCHANGHYSPIQCHGSTGYCWCADIDGNERPYTRIRGRPNCNLNGNYFTSSIHSDMRFYCMLHDLLVARIGNDRAQRKA